MVCDWPLHEPVASDGKPQPHCHLLTTTRAIDPAKPTGFGKKMRELDRRDLIVEWRQGWEQSANHALELADREERIDARSLEARFRDALERGDFEEAACFDREPLPHLGAAAHAMERQGIATDIGDELRAIAEENSSRAAAYEAVREMAADVPEAPGRFLEMRAASDDPVGAFEKWGEWARDALEQLREMALAAVERVQEAALSAWDNLVAAMSPMSDFALAERAAAEEREAELDRAIDEVLAETDTPEPGAEIEPGEQDPEMEAILAELDRDDREREAAIEVLEQEHEPSFRDRLAAAMRERTERNLERAMRREPPGLEIEM
jgi:hypothetical protein